MTAVPVQVSGRNEPTATALKGSILVADDPADVIAVERSGSEVVVVIEASAGPSLGGHGRTLDVSPQYSRTGLDLEGGDAVRFMSAEPTRVVTGSLPYDLFPISTPFTGEDGELPYLLTHVNLGSSGTGQRLADAVATAGAAPCS